MSDELKALLDAEEIVEKSYTAMYSHEEGRTSPAARHLMQRIMDRLEQRIAGLVMPKEPRGS